MKLLLILALCIFGVALAYQLTETRSQTEIVISCGAVGQEIELCHSGAREWEKLTGNKVRVLSSPGSSTERLGLFLQLLSAHSPDVDVFTIDATWAGIVESFFIDLREHFSEEHLNDFFEGSLFSNTVQGRLVALPWYMDAGLLFYRKDLLEKYGEPVPETWEDLTRIAARIQKAERELGQADLWGFVFQGRAYEGLTCNALEWIASYQGGTILDDQAQPTILNSNAIRALELSQSWIGTISPPGVLNYTEEEARGVFQSGNAVFLRNWPYVQQLADAPKSMIRGKVGLHALPKGSPQDGSEGRSASVMGGWSLGVSRFSRNPKIAIDLVRHLTSSAEMRRRLLVGGYNPTRKSLYQDADLNRRLPHLTSMFEVFRSHLILRPSVAAGPTYNRVSAEFWEAVHRTLSSQAPVTEQLEHLSTRLKLITRGTP